ncbi:MAG TPA: hypothetical protein VGL56_13850 [Fimbriimonadaceae bacterium]|jgi:hypothetical protein
MSAYANMVTLSRLLLREGVHCILPASEDSIHASLSQSEYQEFKRRVSFSYLTKIRDPRTFALLAVNMDKHGIDDYIGANTFAEIAVAFAQRKRVYLLQDIPEGYEDELVAWKVVALNGHLDGLVRDYRNSVKEAGLQTALFDI